MLLWSSPLFSFQLLRWSPFVFFLVFFVNLDLFSLFGRYLYILYDVGVAFIIDTFLWWDQEKQVGCWYGESLWRGHYWCKENCPFHVRFKEMIFSEKRSLGAAAIVCYPLYAMSVFEGFRCITLYSVVYLSWDMYWMCCLSNYQTVMVQTLNLNPLLKFIFRRVIFYKNGVLMFSWIDHYMQRRV